MNWNNWKIAFYLIYSKYQTAISYFDEHENKYDLKNSSLQYAANSRQTGGEALIMDHTGGLRLKATFFRLEEYETVRIAWVEIYKQVRKTHLGI